MVKKVVIKNLPLPIPSKYLPDFFEVAKEVIKYRKVKEREETKREQIRAIKELFNTVLGFYENKFDKLLTTKKQQREKTFEEFFIQLREALQKGDTEMVNILCQSIVEVHKTPIITEEEAKAMLEEAIKETSQASFRDTNTDDDEKDNDILPAKIIW